MPRSEVVYQFVDVATGRAVVNAGAYLYEPGTLTPLEAWAVPAGGEPINPPALTLADGFLRAWVADQWATVDVALDDNDGTAYLGPDPDDRHTFSPFTETVTTLGGSSGQATVCRTVIVSGVGASYTTADKARRVSVTWDNASSNDAQRPTIDGVPLAATTGPATITFGTLASGAPLPPVTVATHQNNDAVTILEEC